MGDTKQLTGDSFAKFDSAFIKSLDVSRNFFSPEYEKVLQEDATRTHAKDIVGFNQDKYDRLDKPFNPYDPTLDQQLADSQSRIEQFGAFLNQAVVGEAVGGTIEGIGILLDVFDGANYADGIEKKWTNWFSEIGSDLRDWTREATPVYQQHEGEFAPWSWSWWMANGSSVASTLSLMIPAAGVMKGLSLGAKALRLEEGLLNTFTKGIQTASKLGKVDDAVAMEQSFVKAQRTAQKLVKDISGISSAGVQAAVSRHMENVMESHQAYDETYNAYIAIKGNDPDAELKAKQAAATAATKTYNADLAMLAMDFAQYLALPKFSTRAEIKSNKVLQAADKVALSDAAKKTIQRKIALTAVTQQLPEAFEEGWQFIANEEGKYLGLKEAGLDDGSTFGERMNRYTKDGEFWTSAWMGAVGGAAFAAAAKPIQDWIHGKNTIEDKRVNDLNQYGEKWSWLQDKYKQAQISGDPEDLNFVRDQFTRMFGSNAIKLGNTGFAIDFLKGKINEYQNLTPEQADAQNIDKTKIIEFTQKQIQEIESLETKTKNHIKEFGELAPYVAEAEYMMDKADEHLDRLDREKEELFKEVGARRSMSTFAEQINELHRENLGLAHAEEQIRRMIDSNKNAPEDKRLPESFFLKHEQILSNLNKQLKENTKKITELESSSEYTAEEKRKDKAKGKSAVFNRLLANANRIGTNRVYTELYKLYKNQAEDKLTQLQNPTKRKSIITKKMLDNVMPTITDEEKLDNFINTVDLQKYHNELVARAIENKRRTLNDDKVNAFLSNENMTYEEFKNNFPKGIMSKESAQKLKDREEQLRPKQEIVPPAPIEKVKDEIEEPPIKDDITEEFTPKEPIVEPELPFVGMPTENVLPQEETFDPEEITNERPLNEEDFQSAFDGLTAFDEENEANNNNLEDIIPEQVVGTEDIKEEEIPEEDIPEEQEPDMPDDLNQAKKNQEELFGNTTPEPSEKTSVGLKSANSIGQKKDKNNIPDENYPKQHGKPKNSSMEEESVLPLHIFPNTLKGKVLPFHYNMTQSPNLLLDEVEFQLLENDWWRKHKSEYPNEYEGIPIVIIYNEEQIGVLSIADSKGRKEIYDAIKAGKKVTSKVVSKTKGFYNNVLVQDKDGNWINHFMSVKNAQKRWHYNSSTRRYELKESNNVFVVIRGIDMPQGSLRIVSPTQDRDQATEEFINLATIQNRPTNDDKGHVYLITTDTFGKAKAVKLSTANLSAQAIDKTIELIKKGDGTSASQIVAINDNIPFSAMLSSLESEDAISSDYSSDTFIKIDDVFTTYYSTQKDSEGNDIGFIRVRNEDIGSSDEQKFVTRMDVRIKEKDGKVFFDIVPKTNIGYTEKISLNNFNVEEDLKKFLQGKKYNIDFTFLSSTEPYTSKVTGNSYPSYLDYLDSTNETINRENASGRQSILAMDTRNDNGTLFHDSQLYFDSINIEGTTIENINEKVNTPAEPTEHLTKPAPVKPESRPDEPKSPVGDVTARKKTIGKSRLSNLTGNNSKNNEFGENKLANFVSTLTEEEKNTIISKLNMFENLNSISDVIEYYKELLIRQGVYESKDQIPSDKIIEYINQILKC